MTSVAFSLSREQQAAVESQAIERFKVRAADTLREVAVSGSEPNLPRPCLLAMVANSAAADAPLPEEGARGRSR